MSYRAIASALALGEVSIGERLVAFSLASYANSDQQAWPKNEVAAARAGLGRSVQAGDFGCVRPPLS
jgi:hypothetical protein